LTVPTNLTKTQGRALKLKAINFCINDKILFWKDPTGILLRCINQEESAKTMTKFHNSECGGHHYWKTTAHKILRASYYWPFLFSDVCTFVKTCDKCQRFAGKHQLKSIPLKPIVVTCPFQQWVEAIPTRNANHTVIINFLQENIFSRFGCPKRIVTDNAATFNDKNLVKLCEEMGV